MSYDEIIRLLNEAKFAEVFEALGVLKKQMSGDDQYRLSQFEIDFMDGKSGAQYVERLRIFIGRLKPFLTKEKRHNIIKEVSAPVSDQKPINPKESTGNILLRLVMFV